VDKRLIEEIQSQIKQRGEGNLKLPKIPIHQSGSDELGLEEVFVDFLLNESKRLRACSV